LHCVRAQNGVEAFNTNINQFWPKPARTQFGRFAKLNLLVTF